MNEGLSLFFALLFSAFFSGMEIAYLSANRLQIEIETKRGTRMGRWLAFLVGHPSHFIGAMLMGNTIALVFFVIALSIHSRFISPVSRSISANTILAPSSAAVACVAINVFGGVMTSSPGPMPIPT